MRLDSFFVLGKCLRRNSCKKGLNIIWDIKVLRCFFAKNQIVIFSVAAMACSFFIANITTAAEIDIQKWRVKSIYTDQITGRVQPPVIWEYSAEKTKDGKNISVKDIENQVAFRTELFFNKENQLYKIDTFTLIGGKEKLISRNFDPEKPVIFNDTIIPSNYLNASLPWDGTEKVVEIVKKIGKHASFASKYLIRGTVLSIQDAIDLGLITKTSVNLDILSPELLLLTVERLHTKSPDQEVIKQLWSKKVDTWLYEKTPFRESWLLSHGF